MNTKLFKKYGSIAVLVLLQGFFLRSLAQDIPVKRCATMEVLQQAFDNDPGLKAQFERDRLQIKKLMNERPARSAAREMAAPVYIPVVFHVVMPDPAEVTDQMIEAQLKVLNEDFAGLNADSVKIPGHFKPLYGKSKIQFVLAKRTPTNGPTNGINRVVTAQPSFTQTTNYVKHTSTGGADAWAPTRYLNVWVCVLAGNLLGYATFPGMRPADEQGVVIYNTTLPGGVFTRYNDGRTLTHEMGHYFNLYHIWGDDGGACSGSDDVDDTPDQADASVGCQTGIVTDACSQNAPGIMYQNFMDYSSDGCMAMFTREQMARMELALDNRRASLLTSNAAISPLLNADAQVLSIDQPSRQVCDTRFQPVITLRNYSALPLTAVTISASVDGGTPVVTNWTGTLASLATVSVKLNAVNTGASGAHTLRVQVSMPNGIVDMGPANDVVSKAFEYPVAITQVIEGFETGAFPPDGWELINPDRAQSWERITGIAKTGAAAMLAPNWSYNSKGQMDQLRLPPLSLTAADSAFLSFQVAAAIKTNAGTLLNSWDTLQVLVSTDCGHTFTSLYKKWGGNLATRAGNTTSEFIPAASEWRKDSVNLTPYINKGAIIIAFANSNGNENNVYVDDINLYKKQSSVTVTASELVIAPNPVTNRLTVKFPAPPENLKAISIYNSVGQQVAEKPANNSQLYRFELSGMASGVYIVQLVYGDKTVSRKIIKQ